MEYFGSAFQTNGLLAQAGILHGYMQRAGDCFVAKARNKLVTDFLEQHPDGTDFFFLDDDIGWPPEKAVEFILRPEPVLAGIYPKKQDARDFPVELAVADGKLIERNGLVMALGVPTGFLRIKRHVLETLAAYSAVFKDMEMDGSLKEYYNIFETGIGSDGLFWGEDYVFCQKWRQMGGEIWVDPDIRFTHRGNKKWTDTLQDHMEIFKEKASELRTLSADDVSPQRAARQLAAVG